MRNYVIKALEQVVSVAFWMLILFGVSMGGWIGVESAGRGSKDGALFVGVIIGGLIGLVVAVLATGTFYLLISINDSLKQLRLDIHKNSHDSAKLEDSREIHP